MPSAPSPYTISWTATAVSRIPNTTSEMTRPTGFRRLDSVCDVGKDQVIDRADQQDEPQDQGGGRDRDDLARRNDEDRDAGRVQQIGYRQRVDRDLLRVLSISTTSLAFLVGPAAMLTARIASTIAPPTATAPPLMWSRRRSNQPVANSTNIGVALHFRATHSPNADFMRVSEPPSRAKC